MADTVLKVIKRMSKKITYGADVAAKLNVLLSIWYNPNKILMRLSNYDN